jgi:hypothetical protein
MSTLRTFAAVSSLLLAAAPVLAASGYVLQLGGKKGASSSSDAALQTIEVESFSWGASNAGSMATGSGGGAGKVSVQDLSVTSSEPARGASGMPTGKRAAPVADVDGDGRAEKAAAPTVGDIATFTVTVRESPSKASLARNGACATGVHFPKAVIVARGQRFELADVVVTSCTVVDGLARKEFTGHVTLLK